MTDLNTLSNGELRKLLLEYGKDLPTSVTKDFMIRMLEKERDKEKKQSRSSTGGRQSLPPVSSRVGRVAPTAKKAQQSPQSPPPPVSARMGVASRMSGRKSMPAQGRRMEDVSTFGNGDGGLDVDTVPQRDVATPTARSRRSNANVSTSSTLNTSLRGSVGGARGRDTTDRPTSAGRASLNTSAMMDVEASLNSRSRKRGAAAIDDSTSGPTFTAKMTTPPEDPDPFTFSTRIRSTPSPARSFNLMSPSTSETQLPSSDTFGLLVNGRAVQMTSVPNSDIDPSKFIFTIPEADSVEFVAVFLNKDAKFAPGTGGQIFFGWPNERSDVQWTELGHISNVRPSAMFKITDFKESDISDDGQNPFNASFRTLGSSRRLLSGPTTAQLGISIEALGTIVASPRLNSQL